jgi:hypothetical protein
VIDLTDALDGRCPCEVGPCSACEVGDHARCSEVHAPARPGPATWLRRYQHGVVLALVFEVGHDHRAVCACHRVSHGITTVRIEPVQLDLFDHAREAAA